jgi:thiosulfate dehydrogenase
MRFLRSTWFPVCLGIITGVFMLSSLLQPPSPENSMIWQEEPYREGEEWLAPDERQIPNNEQGDLIRYGKELVVNTSKYLGPKGMIGHLSNGMNCQNCHINAGTQNFANPFSFALHNYPRYRDRSGKVESFEFRVNDCMQRSLNGMLLDSSALEMKAIVAYVKWVGKNVPEGIHPKGMGVRALPLLSRAADPQKGRVIYMSFCKRCHGQNGEGAQASDATG